MAAAVVLVALLIPVFTRMTGNSAKDGRIAEPDTLYEMINGMKVTYGTFRLFGSTAHQQKAIDELDLTSPLMLFIGNETKGLSYAYKELCDELCTIPMAESSAASSFDVSCAASIMMYEVVRQRKGKL